MPSLKILIFIVIISIIGQVSGGPLAGAACCTACCGVYGGVSGPGFVGVFLVCEASCIATCGIATALLCPPCPIAFGAPTP